MQFSDIFDIKSLDDFQLGHLEFIVNSPSYTDVFEPYLKRIRLSLYTRLLDPSQTRKDEYPDDFIRGSIATIDGFLRLFNRLISETDIERIARSQIVIQDEEVYEKMRKEGHIKPITGFEEPYDPNEDF